MKTVTDTLGVARSNLAVQASLQRPSWRRGRPPQPEAELVAEIKALIAGASGRSYADQDRAEREAQTRRVRELAGAGE